jgi:hypothetical protein
MKADISIDRLSKKREQEKNYENVFMQQGRVLTDADWNDYVKIKENHDVRSLRDIIGKDGVPLEQKDSFKITPIEGQGNRYKIGKGRIYVDGILVENFSDVEAFSDVEGSIKSQPYLPSLLSSQSQPISEAIPTEPGIYLTYLDVWNRHITYIEDPDIQESALGGVDTTTRQQIVWQVKVHKLKDTESINEEVNKENKYAPWIKLDNLPNHKVTDMRIGTNNDGSLLEVFGLDFDQQSGRQGARVSRRQESIDPVKWEEKWELASEDFTFSKIEIALKSFNNLQILATFGNENKFLNHTFKTIRDDNTRWGRSENPATSEPLKAKEIALGNNITTDKFDLFGTRSEDEKIYHSKQKNDYLDPESWKIIGNIDDNLKFIKFSVIFNPNNDRLEIYAISTEGGRILYTKQEQPDSIEWEKWEEINKDIEPGDPEHFDEIVVGLNNKKQVIIFVREQRKGKVWSTTRTEPDFPFGSGWRAVGDNDPGILISSSGSFSIQNNPKKDYRLELFGIFSESENVTNSGKLWNIVEGIEGDWNLKWKIIDDELTVVNVASATDKKARVNVFAIEDQTGIVHHSFIEDTKSSLTCEKDIPSWESKIKSSTLQMKARTVQGVLPDDPCLLPEQAGYRKLENQLYRIEIHDPQSAESKATFKYSRDNGSICSKIVNISGEKITVSSIGRDRLLGFHVGEWIEISDDTLDLTGKPGVLVQINEVVDGTDLIFNKNNTIPPTAKIDNDSFPQRFNPKARKWDSNNISDVAIPTENNGWIAIEAGIEVKFNNIDICKTGDYFTIPARTLKADIEWPKGIDGLPEFVDVEGINHHYAKLALLEFTTEGQLKLISDCRNFFPPLNILDSDLAMKSKSIVCWTHGTISDVEKPSQLRLTERGEYGTRYQQLSGINTFLFPITISYPFDHDKKITLEKLYILYKTSTGPEITDIMIYEGGTLKTKLTNLSLSGDHSEPDETNTFSLESGIEVRYGVLVSVRVSFLESANATGEITFSNVGLRLKIN